jgi:hypothetical protein
MATADKLKAAQDFSEEVLAATTDMTPRAIALDVGMIIGRGLAVVEANGAWRADDYEAKIAGLQE